MKINNNRSRKKILSLQEKKFRKILQFANNNSKFYYNLYRSKNIFEKDLKTIDIEKIPTVDKELLMNNLDDVLTVDDVSKKELLEFLDISKNPNELFKNKYHIIHTSGSSGKLGLFVYSQKDWDTFFPYITKVFDFNFRKKKSAFLGAAGGHFTGASFSSWMGKGITSLFGETLVLGVNEPLDEIIKRLNEFQPNIMGGYFNSLKILAELQNKEILKINPEILVNCGEGIISKDRRYIEEAFNVPMSNLYGFAEAVVVGAGKKEDDGIYLMDDISLIEIKEDHLLLTNFYNKTEPIIRYRIDDYVKLKENLNKKIPFTLIDNIVGRVEFVIWFENNKGEMDFIHPLVFTDFYVNGLDKLQLIINDKKSFDFLAVITPKNKEEVVKNIKIKLDKLLAEKNFTNIRYEIKVVDDLKIDKKTGKFKLILKKDK
jgi:phenylacetate-CoA ligase